MKTMQRRAALLLALLLTTLLAITACSAPDEDENTDAPIQVNTPQGPVMIPSTSQSSSPAIQHTRRNRLFRT